MGKGKIVLYKNINSKERKYKKRIITKQRVI